MRQYLENFTLRDFADILLISALVLVIYVLYRRYKIKVEEKKRALRTKHFSFVEFYYNAKKECWQLVLELFKDEEISIIPLDQENKELQDSKKLYELNKGLVTINLESTELKTAKYVSVSSKNKSFTKRIPE